MKYNININQLALSEISDNMDVVDAAILDYIVFICNSLNEKIHNNRFLDENGELWTWIDLTSLAKAMPLLRIKTRNPISTRIQKIEKNGFINVLKNRVKGRPRLYVKLNKKVDFLFAKMDMDREKSLSSKKDRGHSLSSKKDRPVLEKGQGLEIEKNNLANLSLEKEKPVLQKGLIITNNINRDNLGKIEEKLEKAISKKAWSDYEAHRKELGKKMTPMAITKQQNFLKRFSYSEQEVMVEASIRNGWIGLFENQIKIFRGNISKEDVAEKGKFKKRTHTVINN